MVDHLHVRFDASNETRSLHTRTTTHTCINNIAVQAAINYEGRLHVNSSRRRDVDISGRRTSARRGVDPYGTGGTRPPNICTGGDIITNAPPIFLE